MLRVKINTAEEMCGMIEAMKEVLFVVEQYNLPLPLKLFNPV